MRVNSTFGTILFTLLCSLLTPLSAFPLHPEDLPFKGITSDEFAQLERGEILFRILDSYEDISFRNSDTEGEHIIDLLAEVNPNFLAETLMVVPVDEKKDNLGFIRDVLLDVTLFDDIPYFSKQKQKWYPLYQNTQVLSQTNEFPGRDSILTYHKMKPFEPQETKYIYSLQGNTFLFESRNNTNVYYKGIKAVKEGNMITFLWVQDEGDRLIVYGVGGASAFTFFGLFGSRLDDSFIGRVEAFFSWFYDIYIYDIMAVE
jgi:hypothetical protein